jgi:hypothetical protein
LNPVDPSLKTAWFQPSNLKCDVSRFPTFAFLSNSIRIVPLHLARAKSETETFAAKASEAAAEVERLRPALADAEVGRLYQSNAVDP